MQRYLNLYLMSLSRQFKTLSLYRADFLIGLVCLFLSFFTTLFAIWAIFQHTEQVGGWSRYQVTFAFGYNLVITGFSWLYLNQAWVLRDSLISGAFLKYKIRPINPIFHFFSEWMDVRSLVTIALGITLIFKSLPSLDVAINATWWGKLILLAATSIALFSGLIILISGLAFWATISNPLLGFLSSMQGVSHFPASIYSQSLYILLSSLIPIVYISFLPCSWLLGKSIDLTQFIYLISLIIFVWVVALLLWKHGMQRYELPGT
jgi:ABC-2 type transport system permease protein